MKYLQVATFVLASIPVYAQSTSPVYLDSTLPAAVRAHDVVSMMTLDEKAAQLEDWATAIPRLGIPD
jgi:beta-glucosidase